MNSIRVPAMLSRPASVSLRKIEMCDLRRVPSLWLYSVANLIQGTNEVCSRLTGFITETRDQ